MDPASTKPENVPNQSVPSRRLKGCSLASLHARKSTPGYEYIDVIEHLLLHGDHSWKVLLQRPEALPESYSTMPIMPAYLMRQVSQRFGPLSDGLFKAEKRTTEPVLFITRVEDDDEEGKTAQSLLESLASRQMLG